MNYSQDGATRIIICIYIMLCMNGGIGGYAGRGKYIQNSGKTNIEYTCTSNHKHADRQTYRQYIQTDRTVI